MSSSVLRVFAVLLAIGAIGIGYLGYQASKQQPKPEPTHVEVAEPKEPVVLAARDIPPGQVIGEEDLTIAQVTARPVQSFTSSGDLIGKETKTGISKGEKVLTSHLRSYSQLAQNTNPGERAMAIKVDEVIGAGGFIEPGDQVDVLLYLQADQELGKDSSAQVVLSKVRVLAYGNMLESPDKQTAADDTQSNLLEKTKTKGIKAADSKPEKEKPTGKNSKTAVLAIAESEASKLMLAESSGRLRLSLHGVELEESPPASTESSLTQTALSSYRSEDGKEDKHYIVKRELIQDGAVRQKAEAKSSGSDQGTRVIVHRGTSSEPWYPER
jgi:pilus assembly protein CpaB